MSHKIKVGGHGPVGSNGFRAFDYAFNSEKHDYEGFSSFDALFEALSDGRVEKIILPYENSIIGTVEPVKAAHERAKEKLGDKLHEVQAFSIPIYHALISGRAGCLESIRKVYSHEIALAQCSRTLDKMGCEQIPFDDAYAAVAHVIERNRPEEAALGPIEAADRLGGRLLKDDMSNTDHNEMFYRVFSL